MNPGRRIKLTVEYDGTDLCGWQRQDNGPSVQEHLERALAEMIGEPVTLYGASRTDAGVHAKGQVASFATECTIPSKGFAQGLNPLLPDSISVVDAQDAGPDFHARFSATGKRYRYQVYTRRARSPLHCRWAWHRPGRDLDLSAMAEAGSGLRGDHDFSAFRAAGCQAKTTVRRIEAVQVAQIAPYQVEIQVRGTAFLRNMVRIIAGTLVEIGEGRRPPGQVAEIIASKDREQAGQTAPAQGLTLVEVLYP